MPALSKIRIETKGVVSKLFINDVDFSLDALKAELLLTGGEIPLLRVTFSAEDAIVDGKAVVKKAACAARDGTGAKVIGSPRIRK